MSKDRLVLFIQDVDINQVKQLDKFSKIQNDNPYYINKYCINLANDNIHIGYNMVNNDIVDIRLSLNVSYLNFKYDRNGIETITTNDFLDILSKTIIDFIDLDKISYSHALKISIDETNIDMILPQQQIDQLLNVLSKTQVPRMKVETTYLDRGTLYFYSGDNFENPGVKIRIYDKSKELKARGKNISVCKLEGKGVLRIEYCFKRRKTSRELKKQDYITRLRNRKIRLNVAHTKIQHATKDNINCYDNIFNSVNINQYKDNIHVSKFNKYNEFSTKYGKSKSGINEDRVKATFVSSQLIALQRQDNLRELNSVLSTSYQSKLEENLIQLLHIDKKVLTKCGLMKCIDNNAALSIKSKKTAKRIVRYLNKEIYNISVSPSTIDKYKKLILSQGYHYIYSEEEIEPLDSVISQVNNINEFIYLENDSKSICVGQEKIN